MKDTKDNWISFIYNPSMILSEIFHSFIYCLVVLTIFENIWVRLWPMGRIRQPDDISIHQWYKLVYKSHENYSYLRIINHSFINHKYMMDCLFLPSLTTGARAHKDLQPSSAGTMHRPDAVHIDADLPRQWRGFPFWKMESARFPCFSGLSWSRIPNHYLIPDPIIKEFNQSSFNNYILFPTI